MTADRHSTEVADVAIAGATFAGVALALALADVLPGIAITLIDQRAHESDAPERDPRAFAIAAGSRNLLDAIGVWTRVATEAEPVRAIDITDGSLDAAVRPVILGYDNALSDGEPASCIVPAEALRHALFDALAAKGAGIQHVRGAKAVAVIAGAGAADVRLADGSLVKARLLVDADGRNEALRDAANIGSVGWSYDQIGIVTVVTPERPHEGRAVQHFLPAGPFAILPMTGNRCCITWSEEAVRGRAILALDDQAFLAEVEQRFGPRLGPLTLAGPRASWPLSLRLSRELVGTRLALVGEAVRLVHPIAGQGLNLALRDVAALAEVLADGIGLGLDPGDGEILRRYARWRRFDGWASSAAYDGLNRIFSGDNPLARTLRTAGLGLVDRLPELKRWLVAEAAGQTGDVPRLLRSSRI
ncbi:MAG TPA: FAD-dependent monooxygenase [Hyphomicrobiaceae bacterium]|nr:FAD-dependent monooxygenase [Hyphomicrobiaceae bacterium]